MGKRGPSSFKKLDALRAIKSAREAGLEPAMVEIETKDGVTIRVYGPKTAPATSAEVMSSKEWDEAIARERAAAKAKGSKGGDE
jgi:hypothetical protein